MLLAVVIPVYNEREVFPKALARLDATAPPTLPGTGEPMPRRLFIVDDGSGDGTTEFIRSLADRPDVSVICHERNQGKGAALRTGFRAALDAGADFILVHDADLEYDPADHALFLKPLLDGRADVVIGSRFLGQAHRVLYFWHYAANRFITLLCNMATNLNLTDVEVCSKAFTREAAGALHIAEDRFGVEIELIARAARLRLGPERRRARIYEVPVSYAGRTYAEGKKITWKDGFGALRCIARYGLFG